MIQIRKVDGKIRVIYKDYTLWFDDLERMFNFFDYTGCKNKINWQIDSRKFWYSHNKDLNKIYLVDLLYKITPETHEITFKNKNNNDYTKENIEFKKKTI